MAAVVCVRDLITVLDKFAAPALAEGWDNIGLMVGEPDLEISAILIALDPTLEVLNEAKEKGCNTIVTHHPLIFKGLKSLRTDQPEGRVLTRALTDRLAIIACHTNLDKVPGGVNEMLAAHLGLVNCRVLVPDSAASELSKVGFGRIGDLPVPLNFEDFKGLIRERLDLQVVKVAGPPPAEITTVAVCGGSGSELAPAARVGGAQIYLSGEIKHSMARWAESVEFCIVDGGHFATENVMVSGLAKLIQSGFAELDLAVAVLTTESQTCPFRYY
jgi:dinuclear metal center YbgI/SA1388 family protein